MMNFIFCPTKTEITEVHLPAVSQLSLASSVHDVGESQLCVHQSCAYVRVVLGVLWVLLLGIKSEFAVMT